MGGECNYLLRLNKNYHLEFIPDDEWLGKDPKIAELYEWQKVRALLHTTIGSCDWSQHAHSVHVVFRCR